MGGLETYVFVPLSFDDGRDWEGGGHGGKDGGECQEETGGEVLHLDDRVISSIYNHDTAGGNALLRHLPNVRPTVVL